ncbi:MAG: sensor histidine kinase [Bacillota bacterium]|nr:sensor histidine kinase [Bacillota bacterium]
MRLKEKAKNILNHIPLWMQLTLFTTMISFSVLLYLIYTDYQRNQQIITDTQVDTSERLLSMEMQNLEKYIMELSVFSIQSCYDHTFTRIVEQESDILPSEETYIKSQMRAYFYSRSDLESFDVYLLNHSLRFSRSHAGIGTSHILPEEIRSTDYYMRCVQNSYFHAVLPSDDEDILFYYYRPLIRIKTKQPLAMVSVAVNNTYLNSLTDNHQLPGEFICLANEYGELLHSGAPELISSNTDHTFQEIAAKAAKHSSFSCVLDGMPYLVTFTEGSKYHMQLYSFLPMSYIDNQIAQARRLVLISGLLVCLALFFLMTVLIRLLTNPLMLLAKKLDYVGEGDFTSPANISGSLEISDLSNSFNDMILHIDRLIKKNYITELNEKDARITALEAQLNPHFLYNTLQAIATEALINDQTQIYNMITTLASDLRYTIKGGKYVPLKQEMDYVKNYILLLQMRMDDKLSASFQIAPETEALYIPKISIQPLVENSVIHGLGPDRDSIEIKVSAYTKDELLYITVRDNGCGIEKEQLQQILETFQPQAFSAPSNGIGLTSLYGRLHLLYQDHADVRIETTVGEFTKITLIIPASKEAPHV